MKKYIAPEVDVIELEQGSVMESSAIDLKSASTDDSFQFSAGRKRGSGWDDYEQ